MLDLIVFRAPLVTCALLFGKLLYSASFLQFSYLFSRTEEVRALGNVLVFLARRGYNIGDQTTYVFIEHLLGFRRVQSRAPPLLSDWIEKGK